LNFDHVSPGTFGEMTPYLARQGIYKQKNKKIKKKKYVNQKIYIIITSGFIFGLYLKKNPRFFLRYSGKVWCFVTIKYYLKTDNYFNITELILKTSFVLN